MVIPWIGFPFAEFNKKCEPTSNARHVEFTTLYDPEQMPEQLNISMRKNKTSRSR